uniref:Innexin n=1 Tax=Panagrolaimus sp. PS1159 TaxID=55785 RepID=A0AC35FXV7_9BILA
MIGVPYLVHLLNSIKKSSLDDFIDRLQYYTTLLLIFFAIIVSARSFTSPIECEMPAEFPGPWMTYVKEYCYISSTYTISSLRDNGEGGTRMIQGYYQWVAFILVIKALLLYIPHVAWKIFLNTKITDIRHVVEKAKSLRFVMGEEHQKGLEDITHYLKERLQHQKTKDGVSIAGFGMKSSLAHTIAKMFTVMIILFEISFINKNFGPEPDNFWGFTMLRVGLTNSAWVDTGMFPRLSFCEFKQPILGGNYPLRTVQCALPQNLVNEKIFIFVWFLLTTVLILSIIDIFYFVLTLFSQSRRLKTTKYFFQPGLKEDADVFVLGEVKKQKMIGFACDMFGPDGMYLLDCLKRNAGSLIASEIATDIIEEFYQDTTPDPPTTTSKNELDDQQLYPTIPQTKVDDDNGAQPSPPPHDD